jgi:hypothetical protein
VPDLVALRAAVVACVGDEPCIDAVLVVAGPAGFRIAEDEAMLVGSPDDAERLRSIAAAAAVPVDPDAIVVDATDAWSVRRIEGEGARDAFARLSQVRLPDRGLVLGAVAAVPARVVVDDGTVALFVPATMGEHVRRRILSDCAALAIAERAGERVWEPPA